MFAPVRGSTAVVLSFVLAACGAGPATLTTLPPNGATSPSPAAASSTLAMPSAPSSETPHYALGRFPEFPDGSLPASITEALQAELDAAVASGTFVGVTAAIVLADRGSWTAAAGSWDDMPVTPEARHPTHSAGKTIVAAQVLRLVEDGKLRLDALASDYLPPELAFFDANHATVRDVLAMRSGIPGLNEDAGYYPGEQAATTVEVFRRLPEPALAAGSVTEYASTNYVLLGTIIEHTAGRQLSEVVQSDVLAHPGLDGIVYTVPHALASDGWGVEATSASLARWGYELYGGFELSEASLREMTDFQGEWYGLGVMDFSPQYGEPAVGHQGLSSVTTCCSAITLVALPEDGVVIAVQANTVGTSPSVDTNGQVDRLARALRDAAGG